MISKLKKVMNKYFFKPFFILVSGMLLMSMSQAFGQLILDDDPSGKNLPLDSKTLFEHGYNKDNVSAKDSREDVDTVMVTSVMNYFVMPDTSYNKSYFEQSNYEATNLTKSLFEWTIGNSSSFTHQSANSTSTSPWIKVTWGSTLGKTTIKVKEAPQGLTSPTCEGDETEIDVYVIAQPTIGYNSTDFETSDCYTVINVGSAYYDFPVSVTTSSSQVLVNVSIVKKDLDGNILGTYTENDVPVSSGTFHLEFSDYGSGGYGIYEVTITKITDHIARKCDVEGLITSNEDVFTYSVMPQPKTGTIYHIPNNY